ncbi:hypothetical protein [Brevibacterium aurantiacum]|uniref:Uncharacterized protein n=1 Tax=Brevibacterium aurantiacum TaxID=273384 RepID=A0A2A3YXW5_BREAU|nr:hypothetical protein [Brevibacterium aurantiacum]PCC44088.1 hypothetical protein CIK65_05755 [Brevibacterium aurantiacum]
MQFIESVGSLDELGDLLDRTVEETGSIERFLEWDGSFGKLLRTLKPSLKGSARSELLKYTENWAVRSTLALDSSSLTNSQLANALLFFPEAVVSYSEDEVPEGLSSFDSQQADLILLNRTNLDKFRDLISRESLAPGQLSPEMLLELAFAAAAYRIPDEKKFVSSLIALVDQNTWQSKLIAKVLVKRKNRLSVRRAFREKAAGRTAVIVAGQMRGIDRSLPALRQAMSKLDADFYVSTWDQPGRIKLDRARAARIFTQEAAERVEGLSDNQISELNNTIKVRTHFAPEEMERRIRDALPLRDSTSSLSINIEDGSKTVFRIMNNPQKMYYHNFYWPIVLGNNYFSEEYDYVVKVRPDIKFADNRRLTLADLRASSNKVATESTDWKFESWGLGAGDQIVYGNSEIMERVLSIWPGNCESADIRTRMRGKREPLLGHSNIGIEVWLEGVDVTRSALGHQGYFGDTLIDVKELDELLTQNNTIS